MTKDKPTVKIGVRVHLSTQVCVLEDLKAETFKERERGETSTEVGKIRHAQEHGPRQNLDVVTGKRNELEANTPERSL